MEVVVTFDASEGYAHAFGTLVTLVGCIFMVAGDVVGPAVPAGRYSTALAGWVFRVTALTTKD